MSLTVKVCAVDLVYHQIAKHGQLWVTCRVKVNILRHRICLISATNLCCKSREDITEIGFHHIGASSKANVGEHRLGRGFALDLNGVHLATFLTSLVTRSVGI
jgi:hypothetical protein